MNILSITKLIDDSMMLLFDGLRNDIFGYFGIFIDDAQALAACFALLYLGSEAYKMMAGDKRLEIMPLLRPFAFGLLLMFWGPFLDLINLPAEGMTNEAKALYTNQITEVENLSRDRYKKIDQVSKRMMGFEKAIERAEAESRKDEYNTFGIDLSIIGEKLAGLSTYLVNNIKRLLYHIVEFVCLLIWQVCVYAIFFLQIIFMGILAILGPITVAFSILPAFRDAFYTWLARYISVTFYSTIAYIVLALSLGVMKFGLKLDAKILDEVLKNDAAFFAYANGTSNGVSGFILTCLLGAVVMCSIPSISTWIVSTSGIGSALQGMSRGASAGAGAGAKAVGGAL